MPHFLRRFIDRPLMRIPMHFGYIHIILSYILYLSVCILFYSEPNVFFTRIAIGYKISNERFVCYDILLFLSCSFDALAGKKAFVNGIYFFRRDKTIFLVRNNDDVRAFPFQATRLLRYGQRAAVSAHALIQYTRVRVW